MKIFYALETFLPHISGVTISTERLANHFSQDKKNKVYVITASPNGDFQIDSESHDYTIIRIKSHPNPIRKKLKVSYLASLHIRKILDEFNPDIIHIQDPFFISQSLAFEAKKRKIPVIVAQHCSLEFPLSYLKLPKFLRKTTKKTITKILATFINNYCKILITPSEFIKKEAIKWGINIPVEVISNGVNISNFIKNRISEDFLKKYNIEDFISKPIVLYSGRIDKDKNLETLINAIPLVLKEVDVNFLFLGDGDFKRELIFQLFDKDCSFKKNVCFLGPIDYKDSDLAKFYCLATIFVMPSTIEAQSLATMEAMASGLSVVAAKSGALPELIKNMENGFLVEAFKPEEYAKAIIEIIKNKNLRMKLEKKSLELIMSHDIEKTFQKIKKIYNENHNS
jgi:glycosyltransferase involved in cell wall biosynthesis